jgi:hypothetical protein
LGKIKLSDGRVERQLQARQKNRLANLRRPQILHQHHGKDYFFACPNPVDYRA